LRYDPTETRQREAAAFSEDFSRIILSPEEGGGDE
jgi:hypothetical protein